jgi:molybdenum cofactor biosynthesis enzyme MoaA
MSVVQIGTLKRCNEKCPFCPTTTTPNDRGEMPMDVFRNIVDNESSQIYDLCAFGEPLLDRHLIERVRYVRSVRPRSEIYFHTNGKLLSPVMSQSLKDAGLSRIVVSVYGLGQEELVLNMPLGDWDLVVANVSAAIAIGLSVMVVSAVTSESQVSERRAFWQSLGADTHFNTFIEFGDNSSAPSVVAPVQRCTFALGYKTFDHNGKMIMCCLDFTSKTVFGDSRLEAWSIAAPRIKSASGFCQTCARKSELELYLEALR